MPSFHRRQFMSAAAAVPFGILHASIAKGITPMADMNKTALAKIPEALHKFIDAGDLSGIVFETWHRGQRIQSAALGLRDREAHDPMRQDTIFRIASMSKVITSIAVMMSVESGKLSLHDKVGTWLPELANMRVLRDPEGPLDDTIPAEREITIEDLLTHRAGFTYGMFARGPIAQAYAEIGDIHDMTISPDEWLKRLGKLPLVYQPGQFMNYGHSTEVAGFLLARMEQASLGDIVRNRVTGPLAMPDTGFFVPSDQQSRIAVPYGVLDASASLEAVRMPVPSAPPIWESGGGGMLSTAGDYARLARMLVNGGTLDGVRLLKPETVREMAKNRLSAAQRKHPFVGRPMWDAMGFGLGLAMVENPDSSLLGYGAPGAFGWPGAWGTWWQGDPKNDLVMVYMIQHVIPLTPDMGETIASARGQAGRMALPIYQKMTYDALGG